MKRVPQLGTSLVETLVSIALLGGIMIPLLFVSSANFLGQLASLRDNADAYQSTSYFLNKFIDTLQSAKRVLPESTDMEIHLAYYDMILDREMKVGYKIEDMGSYRILHEMVYNPATQQWTETSPYPLMEADEISLPDTVSFSYCLDSACSGNTDVSTEPERSALVKLTGWTFTSVEQTATLPDIDIYTGTNTSSGSAGGSILSDGVRELYSFHNSTSFGTDADLTRVNLTPDGNKLTYANFNGEYTPPGLTILTSQNAYVGYKAGVPGANDDGQIFFVNTNFSGGAAWTWTPDAGLSTIQPTNGMACKGQEALAVDGNNRFYWGNCHDHSRGWTWHQDTGLSTLLPSAAPKLGNGTMCASSDRVFMGAGPDNPGYATWKAGEGLNGFFTSGYNVAFPNHWGVGGMSYNNCNSSGLWVGGEYNNGRVLTWNPNDGLSTITSGLHYPVAYGSVRVSESGRVFFGSGDSSGAFYTWKADTGLSTLINSERYLGQGAIGLGADDTIFVGEDGDPGGFWVWNESTGLSTIFDNDQTYPGRYSTIVADDNRVYIGQDENPGNFWTWKADTGLSTIVSGENRPGTFNIDFGNDGRMYFGEQGVGSFWSWVEGEGLTTIVTSERNPGVSSIAVHKSSSRVLFGEDNGSNDSGIDLFTWHPDTGLSTVIEDERGPGVESLVISGDYAFFHVGDNCCGGSYYAYTWGAQQKTGDKETSRISSSGNLTGETLTVELTNTTYGAAFQDVDGHFYVIDEENDNLDRFTFDDNDSRFERDVQKPLGAWASGVTAMAIDQASDGIALLVTGTDTVYTYTDRSADSGSATAHNISGVADTPTGIAVSGRTGNWLIIDSDVTGSGANKIIQLHVFNNNWTYKKSLDIKVNDTAYLSVDASSEPNFKIQYDDESNILYLLAPTLQRTFALALPEKL